MILYSGDKELFDFIFNIDENISYDITMAEADKLIVADDSHNAVSLIKYAFDTGLPVLAILDGFKSACEAFGIDCVDLETCAEGKQELAILDVDSYLYKGFGHIMKICRGNPFTIEDSEMSTRLDCTARSEDGAIISFSIKGENGAEQLFSLNYYINSALCEQGEAIIKNFINL